MLRLCLVLAALSLGACASSTESTEASDARDCFRTFDVRGYGVVDDHRVRLRINSRRAYIVTIRENTRDFDITSPLSVQSSSGFVCVGDTLGVRLVRGDDHFPSLVTAVERAPPNTEAAQEN
ncbi:MAG: hypothetical protein JNL81_10445 [Hyphomonadaceae bacterium]|nr:hypothetical protein [Hyphomonadaceae bacterium]